MLIQWLFPRNAWVRYYISDIVVREHKLPFPYWLMSEISFLHIVEVKRVKQGELHMKNRKVKAGEPIILLNERVKVEIAYPGTVYRGSRFDWTGFVTQITLDGRHTFCVPEQYEPGKGTGGIGFCNEFGIRTPVGYDEAKVGEQFPKIGTGLLTRKSDGEYDFFSPYEVEPFPIFVTADDTNACFTVEPLECHGYSVRLQKTVSIKGNTLAIGYKLGNAGSKPIFTTEYCHNFIGINGKKIGRDYTLSFPCKVGINRLSGNFIPYDDKILWEETPKSDFYGMIEADLSGEPWQWQICHEPSGTGIRETSKLPVSEYAVWGSTHVVSPELFVEVSIKPDETMTWTREYEFIRCGDTPLQDVWL